MLRVYKKGDTYRIFNNGEAFIFNDEERLKLIEDLKKVGKKKAEFISHVDELNKMATSKQKHIRIIAYYAVKKNIVFYSKAQVKEFISRNSKAAVILAGFPGEKIEKTFEYLKNNVDFKWTLETVVKYAESNDAIETPKKALGEFIIK